MTNQELEELLHIIKDIPDGENRDRQTYLILKAAADSFSKDNLLSLTSDNETVGKDKTHTTDIESKGKSDCLFFSEQEIKKMPKTFRKEFRVQGCTAHVLKRKSGKHSWNYVVRYRRNGYNVVVSSNNLEEAKQKFIDRLHEVDKYGNDVKNTIPTTFDGFTNYFFENFYKRKVVAETYRVALSQFKNHLFTYFGSDQLKRITPKKCQELLDRLHEEGKGKTADDVHSLLNMIFKAAVKHCVMPNNPIDMVFHTKHEHTHGKALSKDEEKLLLNKMAGTPFELLFAVALYTGMRPNEYYTAQITDEFIIAKNSKRKGGSVEFKKIPITPMLRPYINDAQELNFPSLDVMRDRLIRVLPKHKLYDLRTTFYTRCQECGVAPVARDKFVGHSLGALGNTYTDLSDEFLLREGKKLAY